MKQIHLETCLSTFDILAKQDINTSLLVSTENQTNGKGRGYNTWDNYKNSVALSFTANPNAIVSLTSIEISILIVLFMKKEFNIQISIKWPNDIIKNNKKVAGILIKNIQDRLMIGIGFNLFIEDEELISDYKIAAGSIFEKKPQLSKKDFAYRIVNFIHTHRIINEEEIKSQFNRYCYHINKKVEIYDGDNCAGLFLGINKDGSAIIKTELGLKNIYSGSLKLLI